MALNHTHTLYDNFVLANEIEDLFNSKLDLAQFVTVDNTLEGVAGDTIKVHRYTATDGAEVLGLGDGNTKNIEVSYTPEEYKIMLLQNRLPVYDEEVMKDPMVLETGLQKMTADLFNATNKSIYEEYLKTGTTSTASTINFDAFVDAVAKLNLPEDEDARLATETFALVHPADVASLRKALKDTLQYVEAYARTGYIGTVAGVNVYQKKDATQGEVVIATKKAVKLFVKKGTEVEQERTDANTRLTTIYSRKYFVPALVDESQVVVITIGD